MSEFSVVNLVDDRLVNKSIQIPLIRGAQSISKQTVACVGGTPNTTNINYLVSISTPNIAVDRRFLHHMTAKFDVQITNTSTGPIAQGDVTGAGWLCAQNFSLADYPLSNLFSQVSASVNDKQVCSYDFRQLKNLLLRLSNIRKNMGETPCPSQVELTYANNADAYLTRSNPMAGYADSDFGMYTPNGAWKYKVENNSGAPIAANTNGILQVTVESYEPILIPPFIAESDLDSDTGGLFYVRNIALNMAIGDANRVFRYNPSGSLAYNAGNAVVVPVTVRGWALSANGISAAYLNFKTLTTPLYDGYRLPTPVSNVHLFDVAPTQKQGVAFGAGALATQVIKVTQFKASGLPKYVILACRKNVTDYAISEANWYFPITNVSINTPAQQSVLAQFDQTDLLECTRRCGLQQDFISFSGSANSIGYTNTNPPVLANSIVPTCAGPVILEFGKDIAMPLGFVPGSAGAFDFDFAVTCTNQFTVASANIDNTAVTPWLTIVYLYDTYLEINAATLQADVKRSILSWDQVAGMRTTSEAMSDVVDSGSGLMQKMHQMSEGHKSNIGNHHSHAHSAMRRVKH